MSVLACVCCVAATRIFVPHSEQLKKHLHLLPMPRTTAAAQAAQAAASAGATAVVNILRRSRVGPGALHFAQAQAR